MIIGSTIATVILAVKAGYLNKGTVHGFHTCLTLVLAALCIAMYNGEFLPPAQTSFELCPTSKEAINQWLSDHALENKLDTLKK